MSSSFATGRNANVFLLCSPLNFNVIKHGCHLHTDCFAFSVMNYLSSSQALWAEAQRRHRLVLQRLQRSPGRGGPLGAVAEDKTQKHLETQDGPRGEDLGPAEGRRASNTDLQLCFMTLTPLYYRLKERWTEATRRGWWETHCGWGEGVENKLQTTEASSRFTKSSTARGDYNWDYWRHSVAAARQQVDRCQGGEESQGDTTEMTSLLPGLSVLEWSCCASVWVCELNGPLLSSRSFLFLMYVPSIGFLQPSPYSSSPQTAAWHKLWHLRAGRRPPRARCGHEAGRWEIWT